MFNVLSPAYKVGDVISYKAFGGLRRVVLVTEKHHEVKNGLPGFSGQEVDTKTLKPFDCEGVLCGVWGYDYQITGIVKRA